MPQQSPETLKCSTRISRYLDISSCSFLFSNFIQNNFIYYPLVLHFAEKSITDNRENATKSIENDIKNQVSFYEDLMSKAHISTVLNRRLHGILCEVFRSFRRIYSKCLNDLFGVKSASYSLLNDIHVMQPKRGTTNSGLRTVSYPGATLWNDNLAL